MICMRKQPFGVSREGRREARCAVLYCAICLCVGGCWYLVFRDEEVIELVSCCCGAHYHYTDYVRWIAAWYMADEGAGGFRGEEVVALAYIHVCTTRRTLAAAGGGLCDLFRKY